MKDILKNLLAFFFTVIFGILAGTAMMTLETMGTLEDDVKRRSERHRSGGA